MPILQLPPEHAGHASARIGFDALKRKTFLGLKDVACPLRSFRQHPSSPSQCHAESCPATEAAQLLAANLYSVALRLLDLLL